MVSVYASTVHCRPVIDVPNSARIEGSATFTMVASIDTISRLRQQIARTRFFGVREARLVDTQLLCVGNYLADQEGQNLDSSGSVYR